MENNLGLLSVAVDKLFPENNIRKRLAWRQLPFEGGSWRVRQLIREKTHLFSKHARSVGETREIMKLLWQATPYFGFWRLQCFYCSNLICHDKSARPSYRISEDLMRSAWLCDAKRARTGENINTMAVSLDPLSLLCLWFKDCETILAPFRRQQSRICGVMSCSAE